MALEIETITPPMIGDLTDDFHAGGAPASVAIPLGTTLSDASFKIASWNPDVIRRAGLAEGVRDTITFRGAAKSETDGQAQPIELVLEGRLSEAEADTWERGSRSGLTYNVRTIVFYKLKIGDKLIHELDIFGNKKIVDGVDQLADINRALGIA
ncbi:MAG: phage major tail tube protein [Devosia sp.]